MIFSPNQKFSRIGTSIRPLWLARQWIALDLLPATFNATKEEVHFGPSTSQNTYVLAQALRPGWKNR